MTRRIFIFFLGRLECPTFRNKSRTKPLPENNINNKKEKLQRDEKSSKRTNKKEVEKHQIEEPEQLSAEPYMNYNQPYTVEVERDNEYPLPRLPAPIDFN